MLKNHRLLRLIFYREVATRTILSQARYDYNGIFRLVL